MNLINVEFQDDIRKPPRALSLDAISLPMARFRTLGGDGRSGDGCGELSLLGIDHGLDGGRKLDV